MVRATSAGQSESSTAATKITPCLNTLLITIFLTDYLQKWFIEKKNNWTLSKVILKQY